MRQAVIVISSQSTASGELGRDSPLSLSTVAGDVWFLDYLIEEFARHGVKEVVLLARSSGSALRARYAGRIIRGAAIRIVEESAIAGGADPLLHGKPLLDEQFFLASGESLLDMNLLALAEALGANDEGVLALRHVEDASRLSNVEVLDGHVTAFQEGDSSSGSGWAYGGVCLLRRSAVNAIDLLTCEREVLPNLAATGRLSAVKATGQFIDIGSAKPRGETLESLPARMRRGAAFFDRDGTLVKDDGYTHKPEDLIWLPGAVDAIRRCNDAGCLVIIVTNQSGIGRGYYSETAMNAFHLSMQDALAAHGAHVDAFYHCPFHEAALAPRYRFADHPDRKPNPGMLRRALMEWPIDPTRSFMIGDGERDLGAAAAAGIPGYLVAPGDLTGAVTRGLGNATAHWPAPDAISALKICADRAKTWLFSCALPLWWPRGYDRDTNCFHEAMDLDGAPILLPRSIQVQARQTITYARAGRCGWPGPWREAVEAGTSVLLRRALRPDGGTRHLLGTNGAPVDDRRDLCDLASVVSALAEAGAALERVDLVAAAKDLVSWLDANWPRDENGFCEGDVAPTRWRQQRAHMYLFEALLTLYEITGDLAYFRRAANLAELCRDKFFDTGYGVLREYFDDDWHPAPGDEGRLTEPQHQFVWSWLLTRWKNVGGRDLTDIAEKLRVNGELYGVDARTGAIFDEVLVEGVAKLRTSHVGAHPARILANLARFERTRDPVAAKNVAQAFNTLLTYFDTPTPGMWRDTCLATGDFVQEPTRASRFSDIASALFELIRVAQT